MTLGSNSSSGPVLNGWLPNVVNNLTAAGSTQGTAKLIPTGQDMSVFTTVASSTGCQLPLSGVGVGETYVIANHGANALNVYPAPGGYIGAGALNAAYSCAVGKAAHFIYVGTGHWTSNP
jgi:hypothetical protein